MGLATGARVGPYEILEPIGSGGMGEVYRARDARLSRDVAIKILAPELAGSADRLRRFELEARAVGMLNHPNVLSVFDVGTHEGSPYLVTELLVGETLRERLLRGPLPARRALEVAVPVAHALSAAHEKGIVHRDLKPANVFLTSAGTVKVLDFGLAKLLRPDGSAAGEAELLTHPDLVVGTAGYMSPEQVRGQPTDARSDLFAFGAILFEMLTGRRAFQHDSAVETMNAILTEESPELSLLVPDAPPGLARIVGRCLEKKKESRFQSARDLAFALESPSSVGARTGLARRLPAAFARLPAWLLPSGATALVFLLAGVGLVPRLRASRPQEPAQLRLLTHSGSDSSAALSPDGRTLVYVSRRDGGARLFLQQPSSGIEVALTEGPGDREPRFFPDGGFVLFARADATGRSALEKVSVLGGEPRRLVDDAEDGDVSPDGRTVAFLRRLPDEGEQRLLMVASATGTDVRPLARFESNVRWPRFSPDGKRIAVSEVGTPQKGIRGSIALVDLRGRIERLPSPVPFRMLTSVAWNGDERSILYGVQDGGLPHATNSGARLYRQPLDGGQAVALQWWPSPGFAIEIAGDGRVLLDSIATRENLEVVELDGTAPARWLTRGAGCNRQPVFSPDGEWVLFSSDWSGNLDVWLVSTRNGALRRVTDDPGEDWDPVFSHDGKRVLWSSKRSGRFEIWNGALDGSDARRITDDGVDAENPDPSPDGAWIVYGSFNPKNLGIFKVRTDGTGATRLVAGSRYQIPVVSPDGRYVLCRSGVQDGKASVHVFSLADGTPAGDLPFGSGDPGGPEIGRARWTPDGRIAFLDVDARGATGVFVQDFVPGRDTSASRRRLAGFDPSASIGSFGLSPDGKKIVLSVRESAAHVLLAEPIAGIIRPRTEVR